MKAGLDNIAPLPLTRSSTLKQLVDLATTCSRITNEIHSQYYRKMPPPLITSR